MSGGSAPMGFLFLSGKWAVENDSLPRYKVPTEVAPKSGGIFLSLSDLILNSPFFFLAFCFV